MQLDPRESVPGVEARPRITLRGVLLGVLTIAGLFSYLILFVGHTSGSGSYVRSQFPMVAVMPFVLWLFLNTGLKCLWPSGALSRGELLTIFTMLWVVGVLPQWGWSDYWIAIVSAPSYMATPENNWETLLLPFLPWHVLPETSDRVIETFWMGLPQGASIPWDAWYDVIAVWFAASLAMVVFGLCLIIVFQRQWEDAEKLTFPLALMPLDLTRGFDGPRCVPEIFRSHVFWVGFAIVFLPLLYNIGTYFSEGMTTIDLYTKQFPIAMPASFPAIILRVQPLVLAVTYLCPLDILGSLVFFQLLANLKMGLVDRVGFTVGLSGQQMTSGDMIAMESLGAMFFVAGWSVWLARGHLRYVWQLVRWGRGDRGEVKRYRWALAGLIISGAYAIGWGVTLGVGLPLAIGGFALMVLTFFVTVKLIAATGFPYLMTHWPNAKGESFIVDLVGSSRLPVPELVAYKMFTGNAFFGNIRLPVWPAIPHHLRIFSLRRQPRWVVAAVLIAFPVGFLVAVWASLEAAYEHGGSVHLLLAFTVIYDSTTTLVLNPRLPDLGKWGVWLVGLFEAGGLAYLRGRFHWFPLHPMALAFQQTSGTQIYWFSLFLVWVVKLTLLRYGGVKAYAQGKPFFYGMLIGYVMAVVLSGVVDVIWFPVMGHSVHDW